MFAEARARAARDLPDAVEHDRRGDCRGRAGLGRRVLQVDAHAARLNLRIGEDLLDRVDRAGRDADRFQLRQEIELGKAAGQGVEARGQGDAVGDARAVVDVIGLVGEAGIADGLAELAPLAVIAGCNDDVPVGHREDVVGHDVGMGVAEALRRLAGRQIVHRLVAEHGDLRIEQCHVEHGAFAGRITPAQCREDAGRGIEAGIDVGHGIARLHRCALRFAGDRHRPAHALDQEVVAGARRIGAVLAEAGDGAVDQSRIGLAHRGCVEPVFDEPADLEVFDHHIGMGGEAMHQRLAFLRAEIGRDRALAAIGRVEIGGGEMLVARALDEGRAPFAGVVAFRRLDLDDIGAEIGEELADPGPGKDARQFEDAQAGEGRG